MNDAPANPVFVVMLFILRCIVPVAVLLGISYLLRKLGLVSETPEPPSGYDDNGDELSPHYENNNEDENEGDLTNDKA